MSPKAPRLVEDSGAEVLVAGFGVGTDTYESLHRVLTVPQSSAGWS